MIGIIGAMEEENRILLENMTEKIEEVHFHLAFTRGKIENQDVVLVQSGIGKVNSAIATAFIIDRYRPDFVINTGSAGGLNAALHVGDVVVADKVAYHDVDATAFGYSVGQVPQMPHYYTADKKIVEKITRAAEKVGLHAVQGTIVSSDSFIASESGTNRIKEHFPDAYATEMEGASIAQACYVLGTPFAIIRAISDGASEGAALTFDEFIVEAGKKSAEMVIELLKNNEE
ncbi:5'-methylthioadenosine/adenosylhomocysteine nucleosidase [Trichococcus collinsii]|uniref:5'-methylthioadenosine/S-adenosylhomocysteine nucleosidase n=1 Tax=Trichococcus collinsii TaxID=157076 RepID=A0AB37ZVN3_9LACT|nr:5'-methylthioadenosine/adenosylhomocysteine nucleosidase [Trichococcus collinsii]CZQ85894.1 mta/sah nucleosidase [Trichococcus collinsii]SDZ78012.1 adenosylhomocysteine nucleosidase [Trichococcus collinsii]